jgi:hypothetical protein
MEEPTLSIISSSGGVICLPLWWGGVGKKGDNCKGKSDAWMIEAIAGNRINCAEWVQNMVVVVHFAGLTMERQVRGFCLPMKPLHEERRC